MFNSHYHLNFLARHPKPHWAYSYKWLDIKLHVVLNYLANGMADDLGAKRNTSNAC